MSGGRLQQRRLALALAALAVAGVVAACGGGDGATPGKVDAPPVDDTTPILEPDGPLHGVMMTGALPAEGPVTDWRLGFTTADREAVAVVGVGDDAAEGGEVVVAWYSLTGPGTRELLFSQRVEVRPGVPVFSQGVAEPGLAPGTYEVAATLGDRQVRAPWVVRVGDEPARDTDVSGVVAPSVQGSTLEDWEIPTPGEQGWYEPQGPSEPSEPGPCTLDANDVRGGMTPMTDVSVSAFFLGECSARTLTAAVAGTPVVLASSAETDGPLSSLHGAADVCTDLAGGSDLPGTVVHLAATGSDGAAATSDYILPDFGEIGPVVGIETQPPAGTRVEAGDTITVTALAMLIPPALGVKVLYLSAGDHLLESVPNLSGSSEPVSCDLRRNVAVIDSYRYTVPDDPPPVVTLQGESVDFQDRRGEHSTETVSFPTVDGELWEGTMNHTVTPPYAGPCEILGTARFIVEPNGDVAASYDVAGCGVSEPHAEFTGTATDEAFSFPELIVQTNGELIPKVSPTRARATLANLQGPAGLGTQWVTEWDMLCVNC